jgi:hypothetical protein
MGLRNRSGKPIGLSVNFRVGNHKLTIRTGTRSAIQSAVILSGGRCGDRSRRICSCLDRIGVPNWPESRLLPNSPPSTNHDVEKSETPLSPHVVILSEGRRGDRSRRICGCLWDSQKPHYFRIGHDPPGTPKQCAWGVRNRSSPCGNLEWSLVWHRDSGAAFKEDKRMNLVKMFKRLVGKAPASEITEMRSIVIMQRKAHQFNEEELRGAGERGWGKKFDGKEDSMYFVSVDHPVLTVVKAGPHIIRVTSVSSRYNDDDEHSLSQLSQPEQKKAWTDHHACTFLDLFNDFSSESRIPDAEAYASLAKLALQLGDPNCTAVFMPIKNIMMPNDGSAEQGLRLLINKELPMKC